MIDVELFQPVAFYKDEDEDGAKYRNLSGAIDRDKQAKGERRQFFNIVLGIADCAVGIALAAIGVGLGETKEAVPDSFLLTVQIHGFFFVVFGIVTCIFINKNEMKILSALGLWKLYTLIAFILLPILFGVLFATHQITVLPICQQKSHCNWICFGLSLGIGLLIDLYSVSIFWVRTQMT
eukprot:TRINITY_DN5282_c0_g1_i5.p1 TRINITY_DN5282_c0_g1~~TRINITY_DN5282_c0_g1_i5.p1  ORF type:complete len:193 (-),score=40.78 TRINITY_DN5282_c0_g1_i5:36-575(-)